jgi:hypothetical protein
MATQTDDIPLIHLKRPASKSYLFLKSFICPRSAPPDQHLSRKKSNDSMSSEVTSVDTECQSGSKNVCSICTASTISILQHYDHQSNCPIDELSTPFITSTIAHLNNGGVYYDTSIETLTRDSGSLLYRMFDRVKAGEKEHAVGASQEYNSEEYDDFNAETPGVGSDGRFFLDRDGNCTMLIS